MTGSLARIHALLDLLVRRERGLLLAQAALGALAASGIATSALAVAVSVGRASPARGWLWVGGALVLIAAVGALPLRRWRAAADKRAQAARVEAVEPALEGELLTVLDRTARPMGSPALVERIARRAEGRLADVPAAKVLPATPARRSAGWAAVGLLAVAVAAGLLPVGPVEAVVLLLTPPTTTPAPEKPAADGPRALVGDITLRYLYPTYAKLEPMEVPNSSGEVRAPPGTRVEVRARTSVSYETAVLEVYDLAPSPVEVVDGRDLAASFTVGEPGIWRFRFGDLPSPDYPIVPDPDLPPAVSLDVPRRQLTLATDRGLDLGWAVKDDYGIQRVVYEVKVGGATREVEVRKPLDAPRQLTDRAASVTAAALGLSPGQRATLRVGAWDNDEVSGSKAGWSAPVDIEVVGPAGTGERAMLARRQLRDALVRVLADFLVEASPPYRLGTEGATWAAVANARYGDFDAVVRAAWGGVEGSGVDQRAVNEVNAKRREILAFARASTGGELAGKDREALLGLAAAHIEAVEGAILLFDTILRQAAAGEVARRAAELSTEAQELREEFSKLTKEQALARLDALDRLLAQLVREAQRLGEPTIEEYVNQRAGQLDELMSEVRRAIAEGRMDDARALMERLAEQLADFSDGLQEAQKEQGEADERMKQAMEKLDSELQSLEKEQQALREKTQEAREKHGDNLDEAMKAWEEIERRSAGVVTALQGLGPALSGESLPTALGSGLADSRAEAEGLLDSVRARDLEVATERVLRAMSEVAMLRSSIDGVSRRMPNVAAALAGPRKVAVAQAAELDQIRELLEKLASERSQANPELQRDLQQLAQQQRELAEKAEQTADNAGELAKNLPMKAPGLERGARQGAEQASRAADGLESGDPMESEGGQQAAADGFREARDALDQARQGMQQMRQAASGQGQKPEGQSDGGGRSGQEMAGDQQEIVLPAPEEFETPEAYRNALLEGMSGEVPEEYKTLNRRYYEELVRQ